MPISLAYKIEVNKQVISKRTNLVLDDVFGFHQIRRVSDTEFRCKFKQSCKMYISNTYY